MQALLESRYSNPSTRFNTPFHRTFCVTFARPRCTLPQLSSAASPRSTPPPHALATSSRPTCPTRTPGAGGEGGRAAGACGWGVRREQAGGGACPPARPSRTPHTLTARRTPPQHVTPPPYPRACPAASKAAAADSAHSVENKPDIFIFYGPLPAQGTNAQASYLPCM